ncbi:Hsp70 family protein [Dactylosporangium sp. NPDC049525]|uniref:Hsp70 family protein n=1 Tax=Dactylosporangium sp. NPDC049525 TaxID=3154730 RepID=UPI00344200C0
MIAVRYRLGIDFGTSNTVAVIHEDDGRTRPVLFDGFPLLPSCVCVAPEGAGGTGLLVGREATHAARIRPERYEPHPKRRIDDGTVLLGDAEFSVAQLIAAVLTQVRTETVRTMGGEPGTVVLTYPAAWGPRRRSVLLDAARLAGLGTPQLVPEPVAAAAFFVVATGAAVPVGSRVVVYDFGAGTFDASVVTRTATGWDVIASEGLDDAGGLDVDTAIVDYLGTVHNATHGELMRRLTQPQTVADRRAHRNLWEDVRTAKEILSRSASTYIHVPLIEQDAPLGREQLERLARPVVDRTVALTRTVLGAAEPARPLAGLFLVGGSSRMPLVATLLHQATGVAPTVLEQPELVVAEGSARPLATTGSQPAVDAPGVPQAAGTPLWPTAAPNPPATPDPAATPGLAATPGAAGQDRGVRGVAAVRPAQPPQQPTPVSGGGAVYGTPASAPAAGTPSFSIPPVSGRPASSPPPPGAGWAGAGLPVSGPPDAAWQTSSPPESSWPQTGPSWPVSPAASGPVSPTSPAAAMGSARPEEVAAFGAGPPPATTTPPTTSQATAPAGAVRRTLVTAAVTLGVLLLFGYLGRKARDGEWSLPYEVSAWNDWVGEARVYLYPGFLLWLAYLFAAPAGKPVPRAVTYGLLLIPAMIVMQEFAVVFAWAGGAIAVYALLVIGLLAAVILLAARRRLDGTEVRPIFGRADAGGLALGVFIAILASAPEFRYAIEGLEDGDIGLTDALKITEVPALHWFVFGPSVTLAFAGLGAAMGRFVALTAPGMARWLPRIAAVVLLLGALVALSRIGTGLFDW